MPASHAARSAAAPLVPGVRCSRHHHNDPRARFCATCGVSMAQSSILVVDGPRPSLGVLVFGDGVSVPLDRPVVVGRNAETDPRVRSGAVCVGVASICAPMSASGAKMRRMGLELSE